MNSLKKNPCKNIIIIIIDEPVVFSLQLILHYSWTNNALFIS